MARFGSNADKLIDAFRTGGTTALSNLANALSDEVKLYLTKLPENAQEIFYKWLTDGMNANINLTGLNLSNLEDIKTLLLQYSGITWDNVQNIVLQELGEGNVAAVGKVVDELFGANTDPADPKSLSKLLDKLGGEVSFSSLTTRMLNTINDKLTEAIARSTIELTAKFVPGVGNIAGVIQTIFRSVQFLIDNQASLSQLIDKIGEAAPLINGNQEQLRVKLREGLAQGTNVLLNFAASQLGFGRLKREVRNALSFVPTKVDEVLRNKIRLLAKSVQGGTAGGKNDGRLTAARAGETFTYQGSSQLFAAKMSTGIEAKFVNAGRVYALSSKMFTTDQAKADFAAYMSKANSLSAAANGTPKNQKPAAGSAKPDRFTKLKTLQNELVAAEDKVIADIVAGSCTVLGGGCFATGTKLWTPDGYRRIEEFQVGDLILSRDEHHPAGLIEPKPVEKIFVRLTEVWHLHVGEQTIRTTGEHPFYVHDRAWVPAEELEPGDWICFRIWGLEFGVWADRPSSLRFCSEVLCQSN